MKTIVASISSRIMIPEPPNFLKCEGGEVVSIGELSEESLQNIATAWTELLMQKARQRSPGNS